MLCVSFLAASIAAAAVMRSRTREQTIRVHPTSTAKGNIHRAGMFIDDVELHNFTQFQLYFPGTISAVKLKRALQEFVNVFPLAGGRFVQQQQPVGRWEIDTEFGVGIEFKLCFVNSEFSLEQVSSLKQQDDNNAGLIFSDATFAIPYPKEITSHLPLTKFHLFACNAGEYSVLSISLSHYLYDGTSRYYLCNAISKLCSLAGERMDELTTQLAIDHETLEKLIKPYLLPRNPFHNDGIKGEHFPHQWLISKQKIDELKLIMPKDCTTHEIILSLLLYGTLNDCGDIILFNIVNLRNRLPHIFPKQFMGNAAGLVPTELKIVQSDTLFDVCFKVHVAAQQGLTKEACERAFLRNEAYGNLVLDRFTRQHENFLRVYEHANKTGFLVNSWRHCDWYAMDFGSGQPPVRVGTRFGLRTQPRYCHIEQCNAQGDIRLFAMLRFKEAERMKVLDKYITAI